MALAIGCDPAKSDQRVGIVTASGLEYLPVITAPEVVCLHRTVRNLPVILHSLPPQSTVDGLLGLDFLVHLPAYRRFQTSIYRLRRG